MIEHLKNLISMFGSRNEDSVPIAAMAEAWNALPKLLAVVEAAHSLLTDDVASTIWERPAIEDLEHALAALESDE